MESTASVKGVMELIDDDTVINILKYLTAQADVANASLVSRRWRQHVLEGQLWKGLCHREFPELELVDEVREIDILSRSEGAGCSHVYQRTLEKNHRVYNQLYREITKTPVSERNCISAAIAASSTDKFPQESIHETLHPNPRRDRDMRDDHGWSYWSSMGQKDPCLPETLTYKLLSSLCVVHEIRIRPFEAEFQSGNPVYSSKYVRFRLGYETPRRSTSEDMLKMEKENDKLLEFPWTPGSPPEYTWTYVSPEYPMEQRDVLQVFKLPRPVLCMGQILQVELLERVQTQLQDLLYYICVCHVKVVGKPIRNFGFSPLGGGVCGLICNRGCDFAAVLPKSDSLEHLSAEDDGAGGPNGGGRHSFTENIRQLRLSRGPFHNTHVLNRILGNLAVASLLLATEEYMTDADDEDELSEEDIDEDDDLLL